MAWVTRISGDSKTNYVARSSLGSINRELRTIDSEILDHAVILQRVDRLLTDYQALRLACRDCHKIETSKIKIKVKKTRRGNRGGQRKQQRINKQ